jgi:OHCU decarboxylase
VARDDTDRVVIVNDAADATAAEMLRNCCASSAWVNRMVAARPFPSDAALFETADRVWSQLTTADRLEAFRAHPKIGERMMTGSEQHARWSAAEQSGVARASREVRESLRAANDEYERKFGYIFIVCATGKSADEMLTLVRQRLANDPATELAIASEEQRKIMRLRLEKMMRSPTSC